MKNFDPHFRNFGLSLQRLLGGYDITASDKNFTKFQRYQINTLVRLETEFRRTLIKSPKGKKIYNNFIKFIINDKKNILAARPYFRERQKVFSSRISPAIKDKNIKRLQKFDINYVFISFVLEQEKWPPRGKLIKLKNDIEKMRREIVELNLPFAISNAKMFWSNTPKSHLSYMDLVQMATEGLINAIDKFVPPYTPVFRSVAIGRMKGNFMENYNETMLHFYPSDKKKLYRAHKSRKKADSDIERIATEVNEKGCKDNLQTTVSEINELMTAASHVSLDTMPTHENEEEMVSPLNKISVSCELQPDNQVEEHEAMVELYKEVDNLSLLERKYLKLKGLDIKE